MLIGSACAQGCDVVGKQRLERMPCGLRPYRSRPRDAHRPQKARHRQAVDGRYLRVHCSGEALTECRRILRELMAHVTHRPSEALIHLALTDQRSDGPRRASATNHCLVALRRFLRVARAILDLSCDARDRVRGGRSSGDHHPESIECAPGRVGCGEGGRCTRLRCRGGLRERRARAAERDRDDETEQEAHPIEAARVAPRAQAGHRNRRVLIYPPPRRGALA